jgi:hypothetical protein
MLTAVLLSILSYIIISLNEEEQILFKTKQLHVALIKQLMTP